MHWAETLKTVSFGAIYSTHYIRTQKTAHPFSNRELGIIPFNTRTLFYDKFQQATLGKTVLIVGIDSEIGSNLKKLLLQRGFIVEGTSRKQKLSLKGVTYLDLKNPNFKLINKKF